MLGFQLRPTFEILLADSREMVVEKIGRESLRHQDSLLMVHGEYGELHLPPVEYRIWSPHLSFYVEQYGEMARIQGRFAPRVEVWTLVRIFYLLLGFSAFFGFVLGFSQMMLGTDLWGMGIGFCAVACWLTLYVVAQIGQQWSADQMVALRSRLENFLISAEVNAAEPAQHAS